MTNPESGEQREREPEHPSSTSPGSQPITAVLFIAATVFILIGVFILTGRWDIPKFDSVIFFAASVPLGWPYFVGLLHKPGD